MHQPTRSWLWVVLVMGLILLLSATPGEQAGGRFFTVVSPIQDLLRKAPLLGWLAEVRWLKVGHVVNYGLLGAVLYRACRASHIAGLLRPTLFVLGFACLDEALQSFVPGRSAQLSDVILDTTAALIVMVGMKLVAHSS